MPIIERSSYRAPFFLVNGHLQTIFPSLFRKVSGVSYRRERIETPDGDFLDLDWSEAGSKRAAIISHGLEGNTSRAYMMGMSRALNRAGWDALPWNFRGCSGEPNRKLRSYHSGATDDLHTVISHVLSQGKYSEIALIGFSLGGNVTLKYLGERGGEVHSFIRKAAAFSVPCHLASGSRKLAQPSNKLYMKRFLRMLHEKIKAKMEIMPGQLDDAGYESIKDFKGFDDRYTAPIHGFANAEDYWQKCSSKQFIPCITLPTLLINARNDPFLSKECFPVEEARGNPNFYLEMPEAGGHTGFVEFNDSGEYWSEKRAMEFLNEVKIR